MKTLYLLFALLSPLSLLSAQRGSLTPVISNTHTSSYSGSGTTSNTTYQSSGSFDSRSNDVYTPPPNNNDRGGSDSRGNYTPDYGSNTRGNDYSGYNTGGSSSTGSGSSGTNYNYNDNYYNNNYNYNNYSGGSGYRGSYSSGSVTTTDYSTSRTNYIAPCATCFPNMYAAPSPKYRVHFNGRLLSDVDKASISGVIWQDDNTGEILGLGRYPYISEALKESVESTFDGIAIDEKTRLIIYSGENFTGNVLLDISGPAVINNSLWQDRADEFGAPNTKDYGQGLQSEFPQEHRFWSETNMHTWQKGSLEILEKK
jgi:hypothetical protein